MMPLTKSRAFAAALFFGPNDKTNSSRHMAHDATCRKFLKFVRRKNKDDD
jgi:sarcosine oxidase delta subunit